ncbi:MAG: hypothetical protein WC716_15875 [Chitinophagaceae bacterium]
MKKSFLTILICCASCSGFAQVFWPYTQLFNQLKTSTQSQMTYNYKVILIDVKTGVAVDSMFGLLACKDKKFLDSNSLYFMAKTEKEYCKFDHTDQTAMVFDLKDLSKKMKLPLIDEPNKMISISEDFISDEGGKIEYDFRNNFYYRLKFTPKNQALYYGHVDFNKQNHSFIGAYLEMDDVNPVENTHFRKAVYIYNVSFKVNDAVFNMARYYTIRKGQLSMGKQYSTYKITKIL